MKKKFLPFLLALCLLLSCVPAVSAGSAVSAAGFRDVPADSYFAGPAAFCLEKGLINGTDPGVFSPHMNLSRGMLATVLWRNEGKPSAGRSSFTDVKAGSYYETAIAWAAEAGIVNGYGDGLFGPDDNIQRQQLAAMLYRYASVKGYSLTASASHAFADQDRIAPYAREAVAWAFDRGVVNGKEENRFDPAGNATRAEAATMVFRYIAKVEQAAPEEDDPGNDIPQEEPTRKPEAGETSAPGNGDQDSETETSPTAVPSARPTAGPGSGTEDPSPAPEATPAPGMTSTPTAEPSAAPAPTVSPKPSSAPSSTGTPAPAPTAKPTAQPTALPTAKPTAKPAATPSPSPGAGSKTLVAYFSYTGNTEGVAKKIAAKTGAGLLEIVPAVPYPDDTLNYYDPSTRAYQEQNDPSARPALAAGCKSPDLTGYDVVFVGYPIWYGQPPRIVSTFLESCSLAGKTVITFSTSGSSSHSDSGLRALAPGALWRDGQRFSSSASQSAVSSWIDRLGLPSQGEEKLSIRVNGRTLTASFEDNSSARAFRDLLKSGPVTVDMHDYGSFEKVGPLGTALPRNDALITTRPGDVILYLGNQITIYYDENTYTFTRLAKIDDPSGLKAILGDGNVSVTFSLLN